MANLNILRKKLQDADYLVKAKICDDTCVLHFPRYYMQYEKSDICYTSIKNSIKSKLFSNNILLNEATVNAPKYSHKSLILCDMIVKCKAYQYNLGLIEFTHNNTVVNEDVFIANLPVKLIRQIDKTKDLKLQEIILKLITDNASSKDLEEYALSCDVLDGYKICANIFEPITNNDDINNNDRIQDN